MQANNLSDDVEGNPDREDPFQQRKFSLFKQTWLWVLAALYSR